VDYRKLLSDLQLRPGMFGLDGSFGQFCAFLTGVDAGHDWQFLTGFRELLVTRAGTGNNLTWAGLVVRLAFPDTGVRQHERLADPDGNSQAVATLFALLSEFLERRSEHGGPAGIFDEYLTWLKAQTWYRPAT
jgi:hypothetical protein